MENFRAAPSGHPKIEKNMYEKKNIFMLYTYIIYNIIFFYFFQNKFFLMVFFIIAGPTGQPIGVRGRRHALRDTFKGGDYKHEQTRGREQPPTSPNGLARRASNNNKKPSKK